MKKKLSVRAVASLLLSALLFCMPIGAVMANSGNTVDAYAEESSAEGETEESAGTEGSKKRRKALKQNPVTAAANQKKKRRAERYRGMRFQSRNVPVKKNAHSIPLTKIVKPARKITAYVNM